MEYEVKWSLELLKLASILEKTNLDQTVKWGGPVYCFQGKNIVSFGGFKNYFALWFYNGVFLKDPFNVLVNAQAGKTKALRQWRFTNILEIEEERILHYIQEAIAIEEQGLKIKPLSFVPIPIPEILQNALLANDELNSKFNGLTPGRQKEYALFLNEAKQESTKLKRLDKIIPIILNGKGLNDQYKIK